MPSPLLLSFTTMIGRKVASGAFDFDLRRPRHSARKPPSELALPTSTPNSVRWTAILDDACDASGSASSLDPDATTSGIGAEVTARAGASGRISFPAAMSGGAMIDFDATSGVAGVGAGGVEAVAPADEALAGPCSRTVVSATGFSAGATGVVATGANTAAAGAADDAEVGAEAGAATAGGAGAATVAVAGFCRAIAPVTESSPCSRTVTREYSRSRSPLSVSMAEASRRASFWLSLAMDWICCDWRARSAAAIWSRYNPIGEWLVISATTTAPTAAAPHDPSRHSVRRSKLSSSAKRPV